MAAPRPSALPLRRGRDPDGPAAGKRRPAVAGAEPPTAPGAGLTTAQVGNLGQLGTRPPPLERLNSTLCSLEG